MKPHDRVLNAAVAPADNYDPVCALERIRDVFRVYDDSSDSTVGIGTAEALGMIRAVLEGESAINELPPEMDLPI